MDLLLSPPVLEENAPHSTASRSTASRGAANWNPCAFGTRRTHFARPGFARSGFARSGFARSGFARSGFARGLMTLGLFAALAGLSSAAQAADGTWNVDAAGNWSTSTNWLNSIIADGAGSTANFAFDITAARTVTNDTARTIGNLFFDDTGTTADSAWTLASAAGSPLTLSGGTASLVTLNSLTGDLSLSAVLTGTNNVVFRCPASAAVGSPRVLQVSGTNTYTGTTAISSGILRVNGSVLSATNGPFGNSATAIVLGDANTPAVSGNAANPANVVLAVNEAFNTTGAGALPVISRDIDSSATPGVTGRSIIRYASISGDPNAIGKLTVSGNWALGTVSGRTGYGLLAERLGQIVDFTGAITGGNSTVPFNINDFAGGNTSGIVRLSNANNSFADGISITSGTLLIANNAPATSNGALGINPTLTVATNGVTGVTATPTALIDGAFTVAKTVSLDSNGTQAYSYVLGGNAASASSFAGAVNTVSNVTSRTLNLSQVAGGAVTFGGVIGANADATGVTRVNKIGNGTVVLSGSNLYDGTTTVSNGTLLANNTAGSATGAGAVTVVAATPAVNGQTGGFNNTSGAVANYQRIDNISNVVAAGLQVGQSVTASTSTNTLNAAPNTVTSGGALPAGTLITGITVGTTGTNTSTVFINNSYSVPALSTRNFTDLAFGALSGTLGGSGTITGAVTTGAGSALAPGSAANTIGILKTGALALNGSLQADVNSSTVGSGYDQVDVTGTVTLGGTLAVNVASTSATGGQFVIINNDGTDPVSGTFAGLAEGATVTSGSRTFTITYVGGTGNDVALVEAPVGPPAATTGAIITEFRFHGAAGAADEYVEVRNKTTGPLDISGWSLQTRSASGLQTTLVPANTIIPTFGHFLFTGSGYSLTGYGTGNAAIAADVLDNSGAALFNAAGAVQDAVGFAASDTTLREGAGLAAYPTADGEYAFMRDFTVSQEKDTTADSSQDFVFVSTSGAGVSGETAPGSATTVPAQLGAPSPEGLSSPSYFNNQTTSNLLDPSVGSGASPNRIKVASAGTLGFLVVRRTIRNNSSVAITRLRFGVTSISSLGSAGDTGAGSSQADVRLVSQAAESGVMLANGTLVNVEGTTLEAGANQPQQPLNGGLGSSMNNDTVTLGTPLAAGATRNYAFRVQILRGGNYFIYFNILALTQ